jgi:2-(1,2-epoxy-1,2-dihydrophenyl)acetyl-CoA isomerase
MADKTVTIEKTDGVGIITLNSPATRNALSKQVCTELANCVESAEQDKGVRALVLTGTGNSFCSGADLREMAETAEIVFKGGVPKDVLFGPNIREEKDGLQMINYRISQMAKPTIAAINGAVIGGGLALALACDMRIAAENAVFQMAFVKRGMIPDCGATYFLARLLGIAKACEVALIADLIQASEALDKGLVNKVVSDKDLMPTAIGMATRIASNSPQAIKFTKQALYQTLVEADLLHHMRHEIAVNRFLLDCEDFKEGVLSFTEKRERRFTGKWR